MMYFDYPAVREADRLAHSQSIDASRVKLSPVEAWLVLKTPGEPDEMTLGMFDGRPAYTFHLGGDKAVIYADNGQMQPEYPLDLNLRTATAWTGQPAAAAKAEGMKWRISGPWETRSEDRLR